MFKAPASDYLVPFDGSFRVASAPTEDSDGSNHKKVLKQHLGNLNASQKALYAHDRHSVLLVFQGMDAAGKDSTIRAVMKGVNPAGCQVFSFKQPSKKELDHDFLWRTSCALPERGRIGIFNRSQYEEVLVVRVHPEILDFQQLPDSIDKKTIWDERLESIRDQEKHLARNGTVILKFWLNVSADEQKKRFLARLDNKDKQWKFNPGDLKERAFWNEYMHAYEEALNGTSREWAPWYAIPADDKPYMRATIAGIIVAALQNIGVEYPLPSDADRARFDECREALTEPDGQ